MIEIFNIILNLIVLLIISSFPLSINFYQDKLSYSKYSVFDKLSLNLLFNLYLLLLISFTKIDYSLVFILLILLSLLTNIFYTLKNKHFYYKEKIFLFFIFLNLLIFFYISRDPTLAWDGLENWYFKAQSFYYNYNFLELSNAPGLNYYPHLGSFLWGFFWKNSFLQYEYFGRLVNIFIFLLSIFSISNLLNKNDFLKPIVIAIIILLCFDDFLFRGYQETLIFSFLILISKYFYLYTTTKNKFSLFVCFLFLNLLPWLKNEGYIFVLIFTISLLYFAKQPKHRKQISLFIFISWILIIVKKLIFYKYLNLNLIHGSNFGLSFDFYMLIDFIMILSKGFIVSILKYKILIFVLISFFILSKSKNLKKKDLDFIKFFKINFYLYLALIGVIYISVIDDPRGIEWWIDNSLDRILYEISGFFIVLIILTVNLKRDYILK
jgi:hypothetical protein